MSETIEYDATETMTAAAGERIERNKTQANVGLPEE